MIPEAQRSADQSFSCEFGRTVIFVYFAYYSLVNMIHNGKCKLSFYASIYFICSGLDCDNTPSLEQGLCFCAL